MKNDDLKQIILISAREEFLEKGYIEASMRNISTKASITTGSVYNRFKDKEAMLDELVQESADTLLSMFMTSQCELASIPIEQQMGKLKEHVGKSITEMIDYIYDRFEDFELIICHSQGSKYEAYIEKFIDLEEKNVIRYLGDLKQMGYDTKKVSVDLIHILCSSLLYGFFQIVEHHFKKEDAYTYAQSLHSFFQAGYNELLGIN